MPQPPVSRIPGLHCLIVADDLTGSCDAAVHFARNGMKAAVAIDGAVAAQPAAMAVAINTNSRCIDEKAAANRVKAAFQTNTDQQVTLFKKIDSSLRGHVSVEIAAAAQATERDLIFVAPALPALGRTVVEGRICLPSGEAIDMATALAPLPFAAISTGELAHRQNALAAIHEAQAHGTKIICFDADSDRDLDQIVALGQATGQRILWVGSAGLAAALARAIAPQAAQAEELHEVEGPMLFGVGSGDAATLRQLAKLRENADFLECSLGTFHADEVREAVRAERNVLLQLPPCGIDAAKILAFAQAAPLSGFGGIVLTGGDTAARFLTAVGADTLDVRTEAMPGIPASIIRGGIADSMCVITKSGAFGPADAFLRCIDFFRSSGKVMEEGARQ